jgi:hypothetical protein
VGDPTHPTPLSRGIARALITLFSFPEDVVADPFLRLAARRRPSPPGWAE